MNFLKSALVSLVFLAVGAGCCSTIKPAPQVIVSENSRNIQIVKHINDSTVALVMGPPDEKSAYCAGVWISNSHFITAAHCAEALGRALFNVDEEKEYSAVGDLIMFVNRVDLRDGEIPQESVSVGIVKKIDKKKDLALIQNISSTSQHDYVKITHSDIPPGETVHIVGHPVGMLWTYTHGVVSAVRTLQGPALADQHVDAKVIQVSAPIWVGNSGGGAFNSVGDLIGICSWITLRAPSIGFLIHAEEIKTFID